MTNTNREVVWSILSNAFQAILRHLQLKLPSARVTAGHSQTEAFMFRAYAEYSFGERIIVISFDVRKKSNTIFIDGDIAKEDGTTMKEIMQASISDAIGEDDVIVHHAKRFAAQCEQEIELMVKGLS